MEVLLNTDPAEDSNLIASSHVCLDSHMLSFPQRLTCRKCMQIMLSISPPRPISALQTILEAVEFFFKFADFLHYRYRTRIRILPPLVHIVPVPRQEASDVRNSLRRNAGGLREHEGSRT
jgi:hypothetical protein